VRETGLTGDQGVLIPYQNRQHLMLDYAVIEAVKQGQFAIYTMEHVTQGLELLAGLPAGSGESAHLHGYSSDTVMGHAQKTLLAFRRACQLTQHPKTEHRRLPSRLDK